MTGTLPASHTVSSPSRQGMDSKAMMAKILDEVRTFCGAHPRSDITLMIIRTE